MYNSLSGYLIFFFFFLPCFCKCTMTKNAGLMGLIVQKLVFSVMFCNWFSCRKDLPSFCWMNNIRILEKESYSVIERNKSVNPEFYYRTYFQKRLKATFNKSHKSNKTVKSEIYKTKNIQELKSYMWVGEEEGK